MCYWDASIKVVLGRAERAENTMKVMREMKHWLKGEVDRLNLNGGGGGGLCVEKKRGQLERSKRLVLRERTELGCCFVQSSSRRKRRG
mmetsp:Transcript_11653/g.43818  ORF Transcript_11653/g.43818 Transcript_11653/m.43818 type:complete len:88 (-) Transcript_11653:28-291(-)